MTSDLIDYDLAERYSATARQVHLTGMQALARIPMDQVRRDAARGLRSRVFISGYPGSPMGTFDLELSRQRALLDELGIVLRPGLNEELGASAVAGSQLAHQRKGELTTDGVVGVWYGKAPGVDRAVDALRHANMVGTDPRGGVLALVGDDPSAKSSTMPNASEMVLSAIGIPVLDPSDVQEALDFGLHGVAMSRASGLWVAMKLVTDVADGSGSVDVDPARLRIVEPDTVIDGKQFSHRVRGFVLQPASGEMESTLNYERPLLARRYARANGLDKVVVSGPRDRIGLVASGKTHLDVMQALHKLGLDHDECRRRGLRVLKLGMIWPVEPETLREFARDLDDVLVVEEKRSFIESSVKDILFGTPGAPRVSGKHDHDGRPLLPAAGELTPSVVGDVLSRWLLARGDFPSVVAAADLATADRGPASQDRHRPLLPMLQRTPFVCSGCPHSSSKALPEGAMLGAGTGCSALTVLARPGASETELHMQMGGEGAQWIGMAPFLTRDHMFQNMGDGTFHHSGQLAIRAAVAAGVNITYKLLYNSAVAMTGGQEAQGGMTVPAIARTLLAAGVAEVVVTTEEPERYRKVRLPRGVRVHRRDELLTIEERLASVPGVTVLIHDQECALQKRRKRKRDQMTKPARRVVINERICEGCGDCGVKSNCLSVVPVDTQFGRKTQIHQDSCNFDESCLAGDCPAFMTVEPGAVASRRPADRFEGSLPDPVVAVPADSFTVRIVGIGGTGVVTVAQILATAAHLQGMQVRGMDQTGLAQKGGAVVSDLKLSSGPAERAARLDVAEADLLLGCDLLVAAEERNLAVCDTARTVAVVSTSRTPTGAMVVDKSVAFPDVVQLQDRIRQHSRAELSRFADAKEITKALFGTEVTANVFMLGVAHQLGAVPLTAAAIEKAIRADGAGADTNLEAFRRGRQLVADPEGLERAVAPRRTPSTGAGRAPSPQERELLALVAAPSGSDLSELLHVFVPELVRYQDLKYAHRYTALVRDVLEAEERVLPGSRALSQSVARHYYKLMAYKDEYEVARLATDPEMMAQLREEFGENAKVTYRLHPPVLRALGWDEKIAAGRTFRAAFVLLRRMRFLRGTRLDPFRFGEVRSTERELIEEYRSLVERLLEGLTPANVSEAAAIAGLPDAIRGYEEIKLHNVASYRLQVAERLAAFEGQPAPSPLSGTHRAGDMNVRRSI